MLAVGSGRKAVETVWSPYQKLAVFDVSHAGSTFERRPRLYHIQVNNTGYQSIFDLRPEGGGFEREGPGSKYFSHYDIPPLLHPSPEDVLLVGAGAGNDAAGALRQGAVRVTAVEIDPVIVDFGRRYHPERPYESERVRVVVDDARSFFATTDERFDVISFGLLDSHTSTSLTNARLDHYVYTRESIARARELLREGGILTLLFHPIRPHVIDRLGTVLRDVFGEEPLVVSVPFSDYGPGGILFVAGDLETARARIEGVELLSPMAHWAATNPVELTYETVPATDDWPYLYLESPRIPLLFVFLAGLLGLLVLYARHTLELPRTMSPMRWDRSTWHFFFLGAAFLLLEVQNISKASVALGNTWLVNAVIISGVLTMVLLANLIVIRWPAIPLGPVYGVLLATVVGLYFVDIARFAFLPFGGKVVVVGGLTTLPMLFSGIVFVRAFVVADGKDVALGANLLGALVGAVLESLSFLLGIKALLLVVALFYSLAMLTRPGRERFAEATRPALDDAAA